jgi:hypothetical protein
MRQILSNNEWERERESERERERERERTCNKMTLKSRRQIFAHTQTDQKFLKCQPIIWPRNWSI